MNADCAAGAALPLHRVAIACCTSVASWPQTKDKLPGWFCVLTALSRHAGGISARTRTARETNIERMKEFFIVELRFQDVILM